MPIDRQSPQSRVDGDKVGQHPLVTRLIKGAFHERPPRPRYTSTWDVSRVTSFMEVLGDNDGLSVSDLTHKTAMLLALPSRSADLVGLRLDERKYCPEGVTFMPTGLAKQSRQSKEFFFPSFPANPRLCPVTALRAYEERTKDCWKGSDHSQLYISLIKSYNPVASYTIARWVKAVLGKVGIDTNILKPTLSLGPPRQQLQMQG